MDVELLEATRESADEGANVFCGFLHRVQTFLLFAKAIIPDLPFLFRHNSAP